jgi:hypothetical protein
VQGPALSAVGEACGSSQRGELCRRELRRWVRALTLAAAIHELVVTTDPLVVKMLLQDR